MIKAVIIDDMIHAQEMLKADLAKACPEVELVGTAIGVVTGAKLLKNIQIDVLFLDIELEDGTGFDLLEILPEIQFKIIFTTASDQHAIKAFKFSAIDYLLKPIDQGELKSAVAKISHDSKDKVSVLLDHWSAEDQPTRLALHNSDRILIVEISDIVRCESENNYTTFHFSDGSNFLVSKTLKSYERILSGHGFLRIHQSHLVNLLQMEAFEKGEGGYLLMRDGSQIPVAVRKRTLLMEAIEKLG
ncbi:MAG: response regulator transcription factor [Saprospiraceae bacterium]|nr:response regulator transcription factor [Saprospiraceae bacterium]